MMKLKFHHVCRKQKYRKNSNTLQKNAKNAAFPAVFIQHLTPFLKQKMLKKRGRWGRQNAGPSNSNQNHLLPLLLGSPSLLPPCILINTLSL